LVVWRQIGVAEIAPLAADPQLLLRWLKVAAAQKSETSAEDVGGFAM
jgi:hypothetical protein